jgi:DNA repair exonuclease SbcCD ATPase subunit
MDDVQAALAKVEAEIEALCAQLNEVVEEIKVARARQEEAEVAELRKKEEQLRKKEEQLRREKEQLRAKELLLLQSEQGVLASVGNVYDSDNLCSLCRQLRRGFEALEERARVAAGNEGVAAGNEGVAAGN